MGKLDNNSEAYKSKEYPELFEASKMTDMASEEVVAYSQSYLRMQEMQNAIEYNSRLSYDEGMARGIADGMAKGMAKGMADEKAEIASRLIKRGFSTPEISALTDLSYEDIAHLRSLTK